MTSSDGSTNGSGASGLQPVERSRLLSLLGNMKVRELAQLAGTSVPALVASVVRETRLPAVPGTGKTTPKAKRRAWPQRGRTVAKVGAEPDLAALLGRATRREVQAIVDRWVMGRVLEQNRGNITRSAAQLRISRRMLRKHWRAALDLPIESLLARPREFVPSPDMRAAPSLSELVERQASHGEMHRAVDRWLVDSTLVGEHGNVSHAASRLKVSRRLLRSIRGGVMTSPLPLQGSP